jgi:hypothetical protein
MARHSLNAQHRRHWWRRAVPAGGVLAAMCATVVGVAGAMPSTSTTDVTFVPLTPAHVLFSGKSIGANKTFAGVVIGGATTAPTNATTVQIKVAAKGTTTGVLNFYPTGNPSGGSGQSLSYSATNSTTTIEENVGLKDELTFANNGSGTATVTATLIGYSTQVTAGDIGGTGGSTGEVLTNNGSGGTGWASPGGYAFGTYTTTGLFGPNSMTIASVDVFPGAWVASWSGAVLVLNGQTTVQCQIVSPGGNIVGETAATIPSGSTASMSARGLFRTTGGTLTFRCNASAPGVQMTMGNLDVTTLQIADGPGVALN